VSTLFEKFEKIRAKNAKSDSEIGVFRFGFGTQGWMRKRQFSDSGNVFSDSEKPMRKMGSEIRSDAENEQIGVQNPTRIKLFPDSEIGVFRFGKCYFSDSDSG